MLPSNPTGVHHMPDSQSRSTAPSPTTIEHPNCPRCKQVRMALARIAPGPKGYDIRTFECRKCQNIYTVTVEIDPMKSDKEGWTAGELKPPK
jgi:hypothetical protein